MARNTMSHIRSIPLWAIISVFLSSSLILVLSALVVAAPAPKGTTKRSINTFGGLVMTMGAAGVIFSSFSAYEHFSTDKQLVDAKRMADNLSQFAVTST